MALQLAASVIGHFGDQYGCETLKLTTLCRLISKLLSDAGSIPAWSTMTNKSLIPTGKVYSDYLKDDERINGPRRRERMKAALDAMKARKKAGINIAFRDKTSFGTRIIEKFKEEGRDAESFFQSL